MSFGSITRLSMSALYCIAGIVFLFTDALSDKIPANRMLIGALLLGYGLLRFYMWQRWSKTQGKERA